MFLNNMNMILNLKMMKFTKFMNHKYENIIANIFKNMVNHSLLSLTVTAKITEITENFKNPIF